LFDDTIEIVEGVQQQTVIVTNDNNVFAGRMGDCHFPVVAHG